MNAQKIGRDGELSDLHMVDDLQVLLYRLSQPHDADPGCRAGQFAQTMMRGEGF